MAKTTDNSTSAAPSGSPKLSETNTPRHKLLAMGQTTGKPAGKPTAKA